MQDSENFKFKPSTLIIAFYSVLSLWLVFWLEIELQVDFTKYGLLPRTAKGILGIFTSPFIHSNVNHLFNNSIPLFVLLLILFHFYKKVAFKVIFFGTLFSGIFTWIIGREAYQIGASGVVYLLFSFIFFSGIIRKHYRLTAVSLMVIFLYGSMIWYIFSIDEKISWEGHLGGFLIGIIYAIYYRKMTPKPKQFAWEKEDYQPDEFDLRFDEDGNYVPPVVPEPEEKILKENTSNLSSINKDQFDLS